MTTQLDHKPAVLADLTPSKPSSLRILGGFLLLYFAILVVNLVLGVGPNLLMKWMAVSANLRAYLGNTVTYGLRLLAYIVLPALALQKISGLEPRSTFFPIRGHRWKDLLFGFLLVAGVLVVFFVVEVRAGWLVYLRTSSLWLPVVLHFSWNFVENDVLNLTGELNNVNLVGAVTHLQKPLTMTGLSLGNIIVVESLAFAMIALGLWLWLRLQFHGTEFV
jgi:hypothetical protein